jgi:predicted phosphodiesterase
MRLRIYSDLHLEQENQEFKPVDGLTQDDVIVLAGDIHEGTAGIDKYVKTHEHEGISDPSVMEEIKMKLAVMHAGS